MRDCEHCENSRLTYSKTLMCFVRACTVWDCDKEDDGEDDEKKERRTQTG